MTACAHIYLFNGNIRRRRKGAKENIVCSRENCVLTFSLMCIYHIIVSIQNLFMFIAFYDDQPTMIITRFRGIIVTQSSILSKKKLIKQLWIFIAFNHEEWLRFLFPLNPSLYVFGRNVNLNGFIIIYYSLRSAPLSFLLKFRGALSMTENSFSASPFNAHSQVCMSAPAFSLPFCVSLRFEIDAFSCGMTKLTMTMGEREGEGKGRKFVVV